MSHRTLGEGAWSYDLPNYLARFDGPTAITYSNMAFDRATFDKLHALSSPEIPTAAEPRPAREVGSSGTGS